MATLTELRQRSRERADMELGPGQADTDHFIKNSELDSYINASIAELYDLIVKANGDYYTIPSTPFTTTAGTLAYSLPADFYKLRHVEQQESDVKWKRIRRYNLKDRYRGGMLKYRLRAGNIEFNTDPGAGRTIRLLYIPKSTTLVSGSDTFDGINAFEEYVVVDAAIKMLTKEESDTSTLYAQKVALIERIHEMADDRDSGESETITDLYMTDTLDSRGWTMDDE
jgi:hypothetical protein